MDDAKGTFSYVWNSMSNWWSGNNNQEEKSEVKVAAESRTQPSRGQSSLQGAYQE